MARVDPVVVVGGGLAGLATAALLARRGHVVRLFEASRELGGRARTTREDGFSLNLGAHALYRGPLEQTFAQLGLAITGSVPEHQNALALGRETSTKLPLSAWALVTMESLGLVEKWHVASTLLSGRDPSLDVLPLGTWLDGKGFSAQSRAMCEALLRVVSYSSASRELSTGFVLEQLATGRRGVRYLDHGFAQLVNLLATAARAHGVELHTGRAAKRVEIANGGVVAVRFGDGQRELASHVVLCVSPSVVAKLVPDDEEARAHASAAVPMQAACLDLAIRGEAPRSTIALGLDEPSYFALHSHAAELAPEGGHVVHALRYLDPGERVDPERTQESLERMVERVCPGMMARVVYRRFLPTMNVSEWTPLASLGGLRRRPAPQFSAIQGLYRAGDWVGSEAMLSDAACASARKVAEAIDGARRAERAA